MIQYLTILTSARDTPATKTFFRDAAGHIRKQQIRPAKFFTVERRSFDSIHELAAILCDLSDQPTKFVIRGETCRAIEPMRPIRRLKYTARDDGTAATFRSRQDGNAWVCLDFDKVQCPSTLDPANEPEAAFIYLSTLLPAEFRNVTFWAQWSSSAGFDHWKTLSAHLWFVLDRCVSDENLQTLVDFHDIPIDVRLFNAVQPHFTAAPILIGDITDPCQGRHKLIPGVKDHVSFVFAEKPDHVGGRTTRDSRPSRNNPERTRPAAGIKTARPDYPTLGIRRDTHKRTGRGRHPLHSARENQTTIKPTLSIRLSLTLSTEHH